MEILLNRWRGTGVIFASFPYITGIHFYALYLCLLFSSATDWFMGLLVMVGFILGESMGWGKWIGYLCYPNVSDRDMQKEYNDLVGYNFPYIHQIANFIVKEKSNFKRYCEVALSIRGFYWGILIYLPLFLYNYIEALDLILVTITYSIGFPFACWLSTKMYFNYESKYLSVKGQWETQEVYYGFIHMLCNLYLVWSILNA